jgi:GNAT superfamily N-acetyltransferase
MYAYWGHLDMLKGLDEKISFVIREATRRFNLRVRPMDRSRFKEEIHTFLEIYNQAFRGCWGFVPLSEEEVTHISASLRYLIAPELTAVAEVDGQAIGCVFGLPDYNPRIRKINGRLFPTGFLRLLWNRRAIKRIRIISANVLPQYQRWGVGLVLLSRLVPDAMRWGIQEAEFSWVMESNQLSRGSLERGGAICRKTYRLYDRDLV